MARVAEVAGISIGSLYQYFPDKITLTAAILERYSEDEVAFHAERFAEVSASTALADAISIVVRSALAFQARDPALHRALLDAMPHVGRHALLAERVRTMATALRGLLGAHAREIGHDDLDLATHVLINAVHANTHDGPLGRPRVSDDRFARELERLILNYLR